MLWLRRLEAMLRAALNRPHPQPMVQPLASHVHLWDRCRDYGQYSYRICLRGCGNRLPC
jgi:hypothetical protein